MGCAEMGGSVKAAELFPEEMEEEMEKEELERFGRILDQRPAAL